MVTTRLEGFVCGGSVEIIPIGDLVKINVNGSTLTMTPDQAGKFIQYLTTSFEIHGEGPFERYHRIARMICGDKL